MPLRAGGPAQNKGIRVLGRAVQIITTRAGHPETLSRGRSDAWHGSSSNPFLLVGFSPYPMYGHIVCVVSCYHINGSLGMVRNDRLIPESGIMFLAPPPQRCISPSHLDQGGGAVNATKKRKVN
jgi:hypothetical protein